MRKGDDYLDMLMLLVIAHTVLSTGVSSLNDIAVPSGPVAAMQGHNVRLWCELKYHPEKVVPVHWQSPPKFQTRSMDCVSYKTEKYVMSCSSAKHLFEFYNMTIMDLQWEDTGKYRCLYTRHAATVDLQILVPVTEVTLKKVVSSTAADPLSLKKYITCTTNCAYPAPVISWFENDQPYNGTTTVTELSCSADKEGQKRTMSTVTVTGQEKDKERKKYDISCTAENLIGEPKITKAMTINYDDTPTTPQPIAHEDTHQAWIALLIPSVVIIVTVATAVLVFYTKIYNRQINQINQRVKDSKYFKFANAPGMAILYRQEVTRFNKRMDHLYHANQSMVECNEMLNQRYMLHNINDPEKAMGYGQGFAEYGEKEQKTPEDEILQQLDSIRERLRGEFLEEIEQMEKRQKLVENDKKDIEKLKKQLVALQSAEKQKRIDGGESGDGE